MSRKCAAFVFGFMASASIKAFWFVMHPNCTFLFPMRQLWIDKSSHLTSNVCVSYCVCYQFFLAYRGIVSSKVCLLGTLPNRPSHSPSPEMERRKEGKWESHAYIFLKERCRWRPWGLLCLFHDQHKQRTTDMCTQYMWTYGHTQQPHIQPQTNTELGHENKSGVWMLLWERALVW